MGGKITVGIIAPSSPIPAIELKLGVEKLKTEGFEVQVHPQCRRRELFFAGTDEERARAFYEYAVDPRIDVLWPARGGYGAVRLLPILDRLVTQSGAPPRRKLLAGYSDATILMEYCRKNWNWATLHAPMPCLRKFSVLPESDWAALRNWLHGKSAKAPWQNLKMEFWNRPPTSAIQAPLVGGNLTVWTHLIGTPYQPQVRGALVFFEDVDESLYRLDRLIQHLILSKSLNGIKGIVLGNFLNCHDSVPNVLKAKPRPGKRGVQDLTHPEKTQLKPLRPRMKELKVLQRIFGDVGQRLNVPVAFGLPIGHGPGVSPLPLGAKYCLTPQGRLDLLDWNWIQAKA